MKMSVRPLARQLRVFQRRHSEKHFSRVLPTRWRQKPSGIEITSLSPLCMLQVEPEALFQLLLALSQKCSDDLHILDLVEGDQPLMPLVGWLPVVIVPPCIAFTAESVSEKKFKIGEYLAELQARAWLGPLKPRQQGALQILYCIVLYCLMHFAWPTHG